MSGHKDGSVALWAMADSKQLKSVSDLHETAVVQVRIHVVENKNQKVQCISSEDAGAVRMITFSRKAFFGGYSTHYDYLFRTKMIATNSISLYKYSEAHEFPFSENAMLVGFGGSNMINICSLMPITNLKSVRRPNFVRDRCLPYTAWGFGLTPSNRERIVPLFAFAWDRLI